MKRVTIQLTDEQAKRLEQESRRRSVPKSRIAREALDSFLGVPAPAPQRLPFAALGRSGYTNTARDAERILAEEWSVDRDR